MKEIKKYKCIKTFALLSCYLILKDDTVYGHDADATSPNKTVLYNAKTQTAMGAIENEKIDIYLKEEIEA